MKRLWVILCLGMLSLGVSNVSYALTDAEAINISGKQRMLSQRMMKNYLMIGSGVKTKKANIELDSAISLFESQLQQLSEYSRTEKMDRQIEKIREVWGVHRLQLLESPILATVDRLMELNQTLLEQSHKLVMMIEKDSGLSSGKIINISGRQRMLSQRIAKFYVYQYWKRNLTQHPDLATSVEQFENALTELQGFQGNTEDIKAALTKVESQWIFSKKGFLLEESGRFVPMVISTTTETILKQMDKITGMYQRNADRVAMN